MKRNDNIKVESLACSSTAKASQEFLPVLWSGFAALSLLESSNPLHWRCDRFKAAFIDVRNTLNIALAMFLSSSASLFFVIGRFLGHIYNRKS